MRDLAWRSIDKVGFDVGQDGRQFTVAHLLLHELSLTHRTRTEIRARTSPAAVSEQASKSRVQAEMTRADRTNQSRAANAYSPAVALAMLPLRTTCDGSAAKSLPRNRVTILGPGTGFCNTLMVLSAVKS